MMKKLSLFFFFFFLLTAATHHKTPTETTLLFTTLGRSRYDFDIFTLPIPQSHSTNHEPELQLTDGHSVNYNGYFPSSSSSSSILSILTNQTSLSFSPSHLLLYVSERHRGVANIYLDSIYYHPSSRRRSSLQVQQEESPTRIQIPLLPNSHRISMKDRPSISGEFLIYVSTHENPLLPRKSWAAVYSTRLGSGQTRRLTPYGVADFSPSVSPSGVWTAVASHGERGWDGEIQDLKTHIYIFKTLDGSDRVKIIEHGGWPSWVDDSTLYYHRQSDDGWWSVYKATILMISDRVDSVKIERITPQGLHAFTPATSFVHKTFVVVATRRPNSSFRHIELFDLVRNKFVEITRPVSPETHHYNPFISPDGTRVGYHRCRGAGNGEEGSKRLLLENIETELDEVSVFRIDGSLPSFSPDGNRIVYVGLPGLYVVNSDGSGKRQILSTIAFATAWDWKRKGMVYTSVGPIFATERTEVDIISINVDETNEMGSYAYKKLTIGGQNNAFPSPSPDGKWVVFRSGRSGYKNLYIMDALEGEKGSLRRLTKGPWTDTMCNWSPDGEWIAFSSDRDHPGSDSFALYIIHPNGTGLKRAIQSGENGRVNHPWFSPDSKSLAFTSDYAAVSSEPIANPHHFGPYGDIFVANADGSEMRRLTHNSYEDGTPTWGPKFIKPVDVVELPSSGKSCSFEDCHWLSGHSEVGVGKSPKIRCP